MYDIETTVQTPPPAESTPAVSAALKEVAAWPEWDELRRLPPEQVEGTLFEWLSTKHARHNAAATLFLRYLEVRVTPRLVREAVAPGKQPAHRLRLLDVLELIAPPLDEPEFSELMIALCTIRSEKVRQKIAWILRQRWYARSNSDQGCAPELAENAGSATHNTLDDEVAPDRSTLREPSATLAGNPSGQSSHEDFQGPH